MSLFKAREWWSCSIGQQEEFDHGCLCVSNIDNSTSGQDKIIIGSFAGLLRVFLPQPCQPGTTYKPNDLLLEHQLEQAILQITSGRFVSGTEMVCLAVLHPQKLAVYRFTGTLGVVEQGNEYQLNLMYEHNLQRMACNMTRGPFGHVKGKDFICVQSMDGFLAFFEQESFTSGRLLPKFLLPGPICYNSRTDSFITVSSQRFLESYRYEALAVSTDESNTLVQTGDQWNTQTRKTLSAEWTLNIGEQALDVRVAAFDQAPTCVLVLGERHLFYVQEGGKLSCMRKLESSPSCFLPYASVQEGTVQILVGTHDKSLLVFCDDQLQWVARLSHVPISACIGTFRDLRGIVVTISDEGHLQCSYLGTNPDSFKAPRMENRDVNFAEMEAELKELHKVIKTSTNTKDIVPKKCKDDLVLTTTIISTLDATHVAAGDGDEEMLPSVTVKVTLESEQPVHHVKLMLSVPVPLTLSTDQFSFYYIDPGKPMSVDFAVLLKEDFAPADLDGMAIVTYSTPSDLPKVVESSFSLPLLLVCQAVLTTNSTGNKITIDTNKPSVHLGSLFEEFVKGDKSELANAISFQLPDGSSVTVLASKTSQRYRVQSVRFENLCLVTVELYQRLVNHFHKRGIADFTCSFAGPLPLDDYFKIIDIHFELRQLAEHFMELLTKQAVEFRAIQRCLLTRFKDKNPASVQGLDFLLEKTYAQMMELSESAQANQRSLVRARVALEAGGQLLLLLLQLSHDLTSSTTGILRAALLPMLEDSQQLGWEETVETAVSHLLSTSLAEPNQDRPPCSVTKLTIPRETTGLKKSLRLMCERLSKKCNLNLTVADCADARSCQGTPSTR
uniref:protein PTHB1 isoform X1 n=1 Tax=Myxine glutinosa TaxID=7769 RepID=UPI00358E6E57